MELPLLYATSVADQGESTEEGRGTKRHIGRIHYTVLPHFFPVFRLLFFPLRCTDEVESWPFFFFFFFCFNQLPFRSLTLFRGAPVIIISVQILLDTPVVLVFFCAHTPHSSRTRVPRVRLCTMRFTRILGRDILQGAAVAELDENRRLLLFLCFVSFFVFLFFFSILSHFERWGCPWRK